MSAARASCTGCFRWPAFARNDTKRIGLSGGRIAATLGLRHDRGRHNRVDRHNLGPARGLHRKSAACRHCYAEALTAASAQDKQWDMASRKWDRRSKLDRCHSAPGRPAGASARLDAPRRILVNALSDLFHESAPIETIDASSRSWPLHHATSSRS